MAFGRVHRTLAVVSVVVGCTTRAMAQAFNEGFESYAGGTQLHGVNGWAGWDNAAGSGAKTSLLFAHTGAESVDILGSASGSISDLVHTFTATSGKWRFTAWQYIPSSSTTDTYFILLSMYYAGGSKAWSTQIYFNLSSNVLYDNLGGVSSNTITVVRDVWVPIIVDIDLDQNTQTASYNNQTIFTGPWLRMGGPVGFQAVDLYGSNAQHVYYDDITLVSMNNPIVRITSWKEVGQDGE